MFFVGCFNLDAPNFLSTGNDCSTVEAYRDFTPLPVTLLLSHPGSGNTWMRYLLERLTGICTGSIEYLQPDMEKAGEYERHNVKEKRTGRRTGFPWMTYCVTGFFCERVRLERTGSVLAIAYKAHWHSRKFNLSKAILLVRNPFEATIADFNRMASGNNHTGYGHLNGFYSHGRTLFLSDDYFV